MYNYNYAAQIFLDSLYNIQETKSRKIVKNHLVSFEGCF